MRHRHTFLKPKNTTNQYKIHINQLTTDELIKTIGSWLQQHCLEVPAELTMHSNNRQSSQIGKKNYRAPFSVELYHYFSFST